MWVPGELKIMIHHHCCFDRYQFEGTPFYRETIEKLMDLGMLEYQDGIPRSTPLGAAFVELLLQTPIPITRYVDPRFEGKS